MPSLQWPTFSRVSSIQLQSFSTSTQVRYISERTKGAEKALWGEGSQCHAEGVVSKCEQTQTNADKRRQTQANAEGKTQANASKRGQTQTNAYTPLYGGFFTPPFANHWGLLLKHPKP